MPRIDLQIDGSSHRIDTPDYVMAGQWFARILAMYEITRASQLTLSVEPFFLRDPAATPHPWVPDWNPQGRFENTVSVGGEVTRGDAVRKLCELLEKQAEYFDEIDQPKIG